MAERASLLQTVQIGLETTPGTGVAANKQLGATSIMPTIKANIRKFKPSRQKFATLSALGKEWVEAPLSGVLSYTDWVYLATSGIQYTAPAQQESTTAYLWANTMAQGAADTVKTYTVEVGGSARAHEFSYGLVRNLGYTITRDEATVRGSMIGQRLTDGITLTGSPTAIALKPVLSTDISVYLDDASGDLGTTKLLRVLNIDLTLDGTLTDVSGQPLEHGRLPIGQWVQLVGAPLNVDETERLSPLFVERSEWGCEQEQFSALEFKGAPNPWENAVLL